MARFYRMWGPLSTPFTVWAEGAAELLLLVDSFLIAGSSSFSGGKQNDTGYFAGAWEKMLWPSREKEKKEKLFVDLNSNQIDQGGFLAPLIQSVLVINPAHFFQNGEDLWIDIGGNRIGQQR